MAMDVGLIGIYSLNLLNKKRKQSSTKKHADCIRRIVIQDIPEKEQNNLINHSQVSLPPIRVLLS